MPAKYPAEKVQWREVESDNVAAIGWDNYFHLFVRYKSGALYLFDGVYRQKSVACSRAPSVGSYLARKIQPNYHSLKIA